MNTANLYTSDGLTLVATVDVRIYPEGIPGMVVWQNRFFGFVDPNTYREFAVVEFL